MKTQRNLRVLVIDDNHSIHEDFRKILGSPDETDPALSEAEAVLFGEVPRFSAHLKFEITFASQGREACEIVKLACAEGRPFAIAFVDVRMPPGWDGIETISHLWQIDNTLQTVVCTAYSDYMWEEIAQRLGRSDNLLILKKPFDNVEVLQLAHALTRKWQLNLQAQLRMDELDQLVQERTSALRVSEERLRQAQKMEAIGQLAAGVAHDFNNILTVIQGHSSLQLARTNLDPDVTESIQQMASAAERAAALTRQLLAFSRKQVLQRGPVDVNQVITRLSKMLRRLIGEHIELQIDTQPDAPLVRGDSTNIEQIILNLVVNARDAMPKGGVINVSTKIREVTEAEVMENPEAICGTYFLLNVTDTGAGMDQETITRIFEPFFTTKEPGLGTGMGLATVHGIVKQHGGWIEVVSNPGHGSTFHVMLPMATSELDADGEQQAVTIPPGNNRMVLLVEDEEPVRRLVTEVLSRNGYRVLDAESPREAMLLWSRHSDEIVLLFTDMIMPGGVTGRELANALRAERPALTVIYTSGYSADLNDESIDLREGVNYLPKPYHTRALAAVLRGAFCEPQPAV